TKTPLKEAPEKFIKELLYGTEREINFSFLSHFDDQGLKDYRGKFEGIIPNLQRRYESTSSDYVRSKIDEYMAENPCPTCGGRRLKKEVLSVKINGLNIAEVTDLSVNQAIDFFNSLVLTEKEQI